MESLESELECARGLEVDRIADAIESIGFECTRCGACCTAETDESHTATVFPDEVRRLRADDREWRDVARPTPYGLDEGDDGLEGETFEWALQTDGCGDCVFYDERGGNDGGPRGGADRSTTDSSAGGADDTTGHCTVHDRRPLICRTYPFSVALGGTSQPMGAPVDRDGMVRAHECEGLGREIDREDALDMARALKARAIRELEEAIAVRQAYDPVDPGPGEVVVHDSEGAKRSDGTPLDPDD